MKTICFTTALLLAVTLSLAQQNFILFGVESGVSIANITYGDPNISKLYKNRLGYAAGLTFQYNFPKGGSLCTGIMYERKGASSDVTFTDNTGNITGQTIIHDNFDYLVVPLMLRGTFASNFFIEAGPYVGLLLKHAWKFKDKVILSSGDVLEEIDFTKGTEDAEFGVSAGIGISPALSDKIVLSFEIKDHKGLTDISLHDEQVTTNSLLFLVGAAYKFASTKTNVEKKL